MTIEELKNRCRNNFAYYIRPLVIKDKCEVCGSSENLEVHHEIQFSLLLKQSIKELNIDIETITNKELELLLNLMLGKQLRNKNTTLCTKCHDKIHNISMYFPFSNNKHRVKIIKSKYNVKSLQAIKNTKLIKRKEFMSNLDEKYIGYKLTKEMKDEIVENIKVNPTDNFKTFKELCSEYGYVIVYKNKGMYVLYNINDSLKDDKKAFKLKNKNNKIREINNYLESIIGVRLDKENKEKLINVLDIKVNARQIKSYKRLSEELLKLNIQYKIVSKRVKKQGKLCRVWIVEKNK